MNSSVDPRGVLQRRPSLWGLLLTALLLATFSACGAPQPPQPPRATIFNSSQAGVIYALNAQNGAVRWQYHTVSTVFGAGLARPVLLNGTIYAATSSGGLVVYALNAQDGAVRWKVNVNDTPAPPEQPVIVNNILFLVASRFVPDTITLVYALRIQDGSVLWHYETPGYPTARNFTVADGSIYLPLADSSLLALDAATGTVRWRASLPGTPNSTPAVTNGLVIINDRNAVQAWHATTGTLAWSYPLATPGEASTLTATNDLVYVGGTNGSIVALHPQDGSVRWQVHLAKTAFMPVIADGMLYAVSVGGDQPLYALRASDGSTLWRYQSYEHPCLGGLAVTIVHQVLYCIGEDYAVVLLDTSSGVLMQHYNLAAHLLSSYPVVVGPGE